MRDKARAHAIGYPTGRRPGALGVGPRPRAPPVASPPRVLGAPSSRRGPSGLASSADARARTVFDASVRFGRCFASSHSRAAWLTGSPMTVSSRRRSAPTLPATAGPAEMPMPAWRSGSSCLRRSRTARAAASAAVAWAACSTGAPKTQRAASPSSLLTRPPSACVSCARSIRVAARRRRNRSERWLPRSPERGRWRRPAGPVHAGTHGVRRPSPRYLGRVEAKLRPLPAPSSKTPASQYRERSAAVFDLLR